MRLISFAPLLLVFQILSVPLWAGTTKDADYPVQYEVINTSKTKSLVVEKFCSMTLRDRSKPNIALNVQRKGYGSCQLLDSGKVFRGRENQKKHELELLIPGAKGKTRVEEWEIVGEVSVNPT